MYINETSLTKKMYMKQNTKQNKKLIYSKKKSKKTNSKENQYLDLYFDFEKNFLTHSLINDFYAIKKFGDSIYRIQKRFEYLLDSNLQILRFGLKLGQINNDRFEPSYALSHYLSTEDVVYFYNLNNSELDLYLNGQTLKLNLENGWILVCYKNLPLSFSKMVNGTLKNFHPKGLRK